MSFDFSSFLKASNSQKEKHPIKIFDKLPNGTINDLWRGQYLALENLHNTIENGNKNVAVVLNTGGGKTVIGLLEGQALANNDQDGSVFYLCGSNQLIMQTAQAAEQLGLSIATYFNGEFQNQMEFNMGEVPCLTNYQALFNGKNTRFRESIKGIIFDDAHVASHIIRENYTLQISRNEFPDTYQTVIGQVRSYFQRVHREPEFDQVVTFQDDPSVIFIPLFVWKDIVPRVIEAIRHEGVTDKTTTKFAWEHLRNNLDLCAAFITSEMIEISPFLPPSHELPFMSQLSTTKLFLSATVQDKPEFVRTFGFLPDAYVEPKTSAGESERLIVSPYVNPDLKDNIFDFIVDLSRHEKVLVISNSEFKAQRWRQHEMSFSSLDFTKRVEEFKRAQNGILVAPARFEGMDFPGDACRHLVIDGLPSGTGHMERFLWRNLGDNKFLQGTVASRLVQAMGRISRGNDDYGVVFLLGDDIGDWITRPNNRESIPPFTRQQLTLGEEITKTVTDFRELEQIIDAVLKREEGWVKTHKQRIQPYSAAAEEFSTIEEAPVDPDTDIACSERKFIKKLWNREYAAAARTLEEKMDKLFIRDKGHAAWHAHWIGYAYLLGGNSLAAERYFERASGAYRPLGQFNDNTVIAYSKPIITGNTQGERIAAVLSERGDFNYGSFSQMDERLAPLVSERNTSNQYEEALSWLGKYLGFASNRPDDETRGRGPDVFWTSPEADILIESKAEKSAYYSKREVGQSHNSVNWYHEEFSDSVKPHKFMIVGPELPARNDASPGNDLHIWLLEEVKTLAVKTRNVLYDAYKESDSATYASTLNKMLDQADLTYTKLFESLPNRPLQREN